MLRSIRLRPAKRDYGETQCYVIKVLRNALHFGKPRAGKYYVIAFLKIVYKKTARGPKTWRMLKIN